MSVTQCKAYLQESRQYRKEHNMPGAAAPGVQQWQSLWTYWDFATLSMVPAGRHHDRPLKLRQPFVFYLGHMPAFTDARLARVLQQQLTEPAHYADMFARGIDPDLEDPTKCHSHSPTPAQWPDVSDILAYRDCVRARVIQLYGSSNSNREQPVDLNTPSSCTAAAPPGAFNASSSGASASLVVDGPDNDSQIAAMSAELQHVLWMCYEHEAMHLETLMYMLVQYEAVRPPAPGQLQCATPAATWCSFLAAGAATDSCNKSSSSSDERLANNTGCLLPNSPAALAAPGGGHDETTDELLPLPPEAAWVDIPACQVTLGFTPSHSSTCSSHTQRACTCCPASSSSNSNSSSSSGSSKPLRFGWDNECPAREVQVPGVAMQHRPVTVLEYLHYMADELAQRWAGGHCTAFNPDAVNSQHSCERWDDRANNSADADSSSTHTDPANNTAAPASSSTTSTSTTSSSINISSTTLAEVLAVYEQTDYEVCDGCGRALRGLLGQDTAAAGLLPGSLTLQGSTPASHIAAEGSNSSSSNHSDVLGAAAGRVSGTAGPCDDQGEPGLTSCGCVGLCSLLNGVDSCGMSNCCAADAGDGKASSTAEAAVLRGDKLSTQVSLSAALFAALQLHMAVKTVFGPVPISIAGYWPIYASALQAEAYAAWCSSRTGDSCRLPTEAEILAACQCRIPESASTTAPAAAAAGNAADGAQHSNTVASELTDQQLQDTFGGAGQHVKGINFAVWHPLCVPLQPAGHAQARACLDVTLSGSNHNSGSSSGGKGSCSTHGATSSRTGHASDVMPASVSQLCDNGWEWTCSTFGTHDGFEPHPFYPEYSQDFFAGKHVVLLGGSWATLDSLCRPSFRNWYQKGQQHVFAKFRLCRTATP